jgi:hypothetical protein
VLTVAALPSYARRVNRLRPGVQRSRHAWRALAVLLCLVAFVASGCGDDEDAPDEAATTAATTETGGSAAVIVGGRVILGGAGGLQSPLDGITVTFTPTGGGSGASTDTDDLGRYSLEVAPGDYDVTLSGLADGQTAEPLEVSVPDEESFQLPVIRVQSS